MSRPFEGRLALVTGASRGIGAAIAETLASAGAHVVLTARTDGGLEEVETRIHAAGGTATIAPMDLVDNAAITRLADAIGGRWGKLDILILNAGFLGDLMPAAQLPAKEFDKVIGINLTANHRLIAAFDPLLRLSDSGRLIAVTSSLAIKPRAYWGAYAASKAALETLVATYAAEVANTSPVRAAVLDPGPVRTAMRARAYPGEDPESLRPPQVVADAVLAALTGGFESGERIEVSR